MPERIVVETLEPRSSAPPISHTEATTIAWRSVSARAPTEVPKALATSLAPARAEGERGGERGIARGLQNGEALARREAAAAAAHRCHRRRRTRGRNRRPGSTCSPCRPSWREARAGVRRGRGTPAGRRAEASRSTGAGAGRRRAWLARETREARTRERCLSLPPGEMRAPADAAESKSADARFPCQPGTRAGSHLATGSTKTASHIDKLLKISRQDHLIPADSPATAARPRGGGGGGARRAR